MTYSGEFQQSSSGSVNVVGPNDELEIDSSGNCGIGVSGTIGGKLHLSSGDSGDCVLILESDTDGNLGNDNPFIKFVEDGGATHTVIAQGDNDFGIYNSTTTGGGIRFLTNNVATWYNAVERLRIASNGNVGIGITPANTDALAKLQVDGTLLVGDTHEIPGSSPWTVSNTQMILGGSYNADFNTGTKVKLLITSYDNDGSTIYPIVCIDENNQDDFYLKNAPSQSGTPMAYFRGHVGIGSSATSGKLNLYQTFAIPSLNGTVLPNNNAGINFYTGQTSWWNGSGVASAGITPAVGARIWHNPATYNEVGSGHAGHHGRLYLCCGHDASTSAAPGICIESTGMVGIGFTSTSVKLSVNGQTYSSSGYISSDDRIKFNEEIIDTSLALNLINQLTPQKYEKIIEEPSNAEGTWIPTDQEWETEKNETTVGTNGNELKKWKYVIEAGMIAQDIRQIPELAFCVNGDEIDENGKQQPLRLDYNNINAYHISATKELTSQLNAEKAKTEILETYIADLITRVEILETL